MIQRKTAGADGYYPKRLELLYYGLDDGSGPLGKNNYFRVIYFDPGGIP